MALKENTTVTIDEGETYMVLERTYYMGVDYYLACRMDDNGEPILESHEILYEESDEEFDEELEIFVNRGKMKACFVDQDELKNLLWMLFREQEKICDYDS